VVWGAAFEGLLASDQDGRNLAGDYLIPFPGDRLAG
jgi:hypothetical protein